MEPRGALALQQAVRIAQAMVRTTHTHYLQSHGEENWRLYMDAWNDLERANGELLRDKAMRRQGMAHYRRQRRALGPVVRLVSTLVQE